VKVIHINENQVANSIMRDNFISGTGTPMPLEEPRTQRKGDASYLNKHLLTVQESKYFNSVLDNGSQHQ
jgi:hypothetical protein